MAAQDWTSVEVEKTVSDYMSMLKEELEGQIIRKTEHRNKLLAELDGRSSGAIELKHQNISAVLQKHGYLHIRGYKPQQNYQKLLEEIVLGKAAQLNIPKLPFESYSFTVLSPYVAAKQMDKSSFLHHGTAIPKEVAFFFGVRAISTDKDINLEYRKRSYKAVIRPHPTERLRLFWKADFEQVITESFPEHHRAFSSGNNLDVPTPQMRFEHVPGSNTFRINFIFLGESVQECLPEEYTSGVEARAEGKMRTASTTFYERSGVNRDQAIILHGTVCFVCGFDFGAAYGVLGRGFIEIHHTTPLSAMEAEHHVNPQTDLVPVCANCHRMLHRRAGRTLSIEELKEYLKDSR